VTQDNNYLEDLNWTGTGLSVLKHNLRQMNITLKGRQFCSNKETVKGYLRMLTGPYKIKNYQIN